MECLFFDTSALVKRYAEEPGTDAVDELIEADETTVYLTSIAIVEMTSAFRRKHNRGELDEGTMIELVSTFFDEALEDFVILPMDEALFNWSFDLVLEDDLRTLDSVQLAASLALSEIHDVTFVCADETLVSVARSRNLESINPAGLHHDR